MIFYLFGEHSDLVGTVVLSISSGFFVDYGFFMDSANATSEKRYRLKKKKKFRYTIIYL